MTSVTAYLINLDRDSERLNWCVNQFAKLRMEFTRIPAVDMFELSNTSSDLVTPGVMACWLSHKRVLSDFLATSFDYALIFEDDFKVENIKKINRVLTSSWLPDFDIVQLGFVSPGYFNKVQVVLSNLELTLFKMGALLFKILGLSPSLQSRLRIRVALKTPLGWVPADFQPGTHCYLISRNAAQTVTDLNEPQFLSADDFYSALAKMRSLKFLRPYRSLVSQFEFPKFPGPRFIQE